MLAADVEARRTVATAADETLRTIDRLLAEARAQLSTEGARLDALPLDDLVARAVAAGLERSGAPPAGRRRARRSGGAARATAAAGAADAGSAIVVATAVAELRSRLPIDDPPALATAALAIADRLEGLAVSCSTTVVERSASEGSLLDEARRAVGDLAPDAPDLERLVTAVEAANTAAIGVAAVAGRRATDLEERIVRRGELETEIEALRERGARFKQLALELRQDRIVAFLQEEALTTLASRRERPSRGAVERALSARGGRRRVPRRRHLER